MKKIIMSLIAVTAVFLMVGCTKVEVGKYKEGTYFGYDPTSKYTAVIYVNDEGLIKSVFIDAAYSKKDTTGTSVATTKQILGSGYGMKSVSTIDSEWYEQVEKIADKVIDEQGIDWLKFKYRVEDEDGNYTFTDTLPSGQSEADKLYTDSVTGVTMHVGDSYIAIKAALDEAKK